MGGYWYGQALDTCGLCEIYSIVERSHGLGNRRWFYLMKQVGGRAYFIDYMDDDDEDKDDHDIAFKNLAHVSTSITANTRPDPFSHLKKSHDNKNTSTRRPWAEKRGTLRTCGLRRRRRDGASLCWVSSGLRSSDTIFAGRENGVGGLLTSPVCDFVCSPSEAWSRVLVILSASCNRLPTIARRLALS